MERITYRITLDVHRNGIQRMLQGFQTADKVARRISINLVASGDTYELPMTNVVAMMYVTTPNATQPSISECVIDGNTIIYDVESLTVEGITEMQLKVIGTSVEGATNVLTSPKFAVEVTKSDVNDEGAVQSPTFTAFEQAMAKAQAVYDSRLTSIELSDDFTFKVNYADGTSYESDILKLTLSDGNVKMSKSWAVGDTGVRKGEETNNSKYYSNESKSASEQAKKVYEESVELAKELRTHTNYTHFQVNFDTGELGYVSSNTQFNINKETGQLETNRNEAYTPEDVILGNAEELVRDVVHDVIGAEDGEVATKSELDAKIRELRGDDSDKTIWDAFHNANNKLPLENIECIEYSYNYTSNLDVNYDEIYVPLPVGFTKDDTFLIGCLLKKVKQGETENWKLPNESEGDKVELLDTSVMIKHGSLTVGEGVEQSYRLGYKLVLLRSGLG